MAFAWYCTSLLCGSCHYTMNSAVSVNEIPVEYRTECRNPTCENFGKLFKLAEQSSIKLIEITDHVVDSEMRKQGVTK